MSNEPLPIGPDRDAMIALIHDTWPDSVVATIERAAFFSLDEKHWPNFATVVWTDEHDEGEPSKLSRPGVYRLNIGVGKETFQRLVGSVTEPRLRGVRSNPPAPCLRKAALDLDPQPQRGHGSGHGDAAAGGGTRPARRSARETGLRRAHVIVSPWRVALPSAV